MNDDLVTVTFDPVRECHRVDKVYIFTAEGHDDVVLPVKVFGGNVPGKEVKTISIPKWLAVNEGLVEEDEQHLPPEPVVDRHDWFLGCAIVGLLARFGRDDNIDVSVLVWDARKIADKVLDDWTT